MSVTLLIKYFLHFYNFTFPFAYFEIKCIVGRLKTQPWFFKAKYLRFKCFINAASAILKLLSVWRFHIGASLYFYCSDKHYFTLSLSCHAKRDTTVMLCVSLCPVIHTCTITLVVVIDYFFVIIVMFLLHGWTFYKCSSKCNTYFSISWSKRDMIYMNYIKNWKL